MCVTVEAAIGARQVTPDVQADRTAAERALVARAFHAARLPIRMQLPQQLAVHTSPHGEARLATRLDSQSQTGRGIGQLSENAPALLRCELTHRNAGGGKPSDDLSIHGGERCMDHGHARPRKALGEGEERLDLHIPDLLPSLLGRDERIVAPVHSRRSADIGDDLIDQP